MADVRREDILPLLLLASREPVLLRVLDTLLVANVLELVVSKLSFLEDVLLRREALLSTEVLLPLTEPFVLLPTELREEDPSTSLPVLCTSLLSEGCF